MHSSLPQRVGATEERARGEGDARGGGVCVAERGLCAVTRQTEVLIGRRLAKKRLLSALAGRAHCCKRSPTGTGMNALGEDDELKEQPKGRRECETSTPTAAVACWRGFERQCNGPSLGGRRAVHWSTQIRVFLERERKRSETEVRHA